MTRFLPLVAMTLLLIAGLPAVPGVASNIDLATVPSRDGVQLTIYNAEDLTLVRETRTLSFKQGVNPLQFSWANTLIDPTSVELRFVSHPAAMEILDTRYPHDRPQMLYWQVSSEHAGEAVVEISYFTSGISWSAEYVGIADTAEKHLALSGYVAIQNQSGEDYENAQVRLVVGSINLVEKIAQLAQQGMGMPGLRYEKADQLRGRVMRNAVMVAESSAMAGNVPAPAAAPRQIVKEGLSEYFIFTIEGREDVPNAYRKRLRSFETAASPLEVVHRYRPREYGEQLVRMFLLRNDETSEMGVSPLPNGQVRLFRRKESGGLAYLAQQVIPHVPIGEKIELNLGVDRDVVFELERLQVRRDNLWGTFERGVRQRLDGSELQLRDQGQVVGWDEHTLLEQRVGNATGKPIRVEVRRQWSGDVVFRADHPAQRHDATTVEYVLDVPAGDRARLRFEVTERLGENQKQQRVELVRAQPAGWRW